MGRREYVSDFSDETVKQRTRLLDLLLYVQYLSRASKDLSSFRLDLHPFLLLEQFFATLHEV